MGFRTRYKPHRYEPQGLPAQEETPNLVEFIRLNVHDYQEGVSYTWDYHRINLIKEKLQWKYYPFLAKQIWLSRFEAMIAGEALHKAFGIKLLDTNTWTPAIQDSPRLRGQMVAVPWRRKELMEFDYIAAARKVRDARQENHQRHRT